MTALYIGCASSQEKQAIPEQYDNLVEVNPPKGTNAVESTIYVDSAKVIERDGRLSLLIMGNFPDGCTRISEANHQLSSGTLAIRLKAWRNPDRMCTQALVSFSFVYTKLPDSALNQARSIQINETEYPLIQ